MVGEDRLLASKEVAQRLGCTRDHILHLRVRGGHPLFNDKAIKLGRTAQAPLRWRESDVEEYIVAHEAGKTWR
ncbi:hypothetical protein HMPREF9336_02249 [Segniliparus rugosus ATCC BAA-974]|uniref:Helix-turn-helix domain-containing protein n=1 Tax=Segniliparus rugosus (strain ATCC BAA-974 / DSM 45345 / CCUG 50838 / CIP 108380 / JCM 13579 / CDC 945) TaxID=679197 RepID=E5XRX7_SEGRC|nr:hypothetical protein HMPREF9336_02249 [Segniliparus rugosus ATCC BAA-974]